jgi:hypothetical protein
MNAERRREAAQRYDGVGQKICEECGSPFTAGKFAAKSGPRQKKFCSVRCARRVAQRALYQRATSKGNVRLASAAWKTARAAVLSRDGQICRMCGMPGSHVHHLFHRTDAERHDHSEENLVTLCNVCHSKIHDIKVGRLNGEVVISGAVFALLNVESVKIVQGDRS